MYFFQEVDGVEHYARSMNLLRVLSAAYDDKLQDCQVLIMPTVPFKAPKIPTQGVSVKGKRITMSRVHKLSTKVSEVSYFYSFNSSYTSY